MIGRFIRAVLYIILYPLIYLFKKLKCVGNECFAFGNTMDFYGTVLTNPITLKPDFIIYVLDRYMTEKDVIDLIVHEWIHYVICRDVGYEASEKFDNIADKVISWVLGDDSQH